MLESDRNYSIKKIGDLKDFVTVAYVIIDDIYQSVTPTHIKKRCNFNNSKMSDSVNFQIKLGSFSHIVTGSNGPFLSN